MLTRTTPQKQQSKSFRFAKTYFKLILFSLSMTVGISTSFAIGKSQETEFTDEQPNRIIDHYTITQVCDPENPNLISVTRADGSSDGLKWTWEGVSVPVWNMEFPDKQQPLDLNEFQDGSRKVYITDESKGIVNASMVFMVYGTKEQYKGRNTCGDEPDIMVWDGLVVFKQANLDNDAWNKQLWRTHRSLPSTANFFGMSLEIRAFSKVVVLSGQKAFNRIVVDEYSNITIQKGCTLTSSCNMWGGIYVEDQCDVRITGSNEHMVQIKNANTGIFILEEFLNIEDGFYSSGSGYVIPRFSEEFPFCFHNNTSPAPDPCKNSLVQLDWVDFRNNYFHFYAMNVVDWGSYIRNSNFTCDPYEMIAPYQPQNINGEDVVFQTEACIVGFMNYLGIRKGFFEADSTGPFNNDGVQFSNNTFSDAFYGILMPGANYFNLPNNFKNIDKCAIRYFYYLDPTRGNIRVEVNNQYIQLRAEKDPALSYQERELSNLWNKINGFNAPARYYDLSGNIARHGLSTGFLKIQGSIVDPALQIGIFVNNDFDSDAYEDARATTCINGVSRKRPQVRSLYFPATFKNNIIVRTGFESVFTDNTQKAYGIYSGYTDLIENNQFEGLTVGAYLHQLVNIVTQNQFRACRTGINIKPQFTFPSVNPLPGGYGSFPNLTQPIGLRLECNLFEPFTASSVPQVGLNLESGHLVGQIGAEPSPNYQRALAGNVWPTASGIDRTVEPATGWDVHDNWTSPSNWTSIKNNNTGTSILNYYRFKNEFVGTTLGAVNRNFAQDVLGIETKTYTTANNFTPPIGSNSYIRICDNTSVVGQVYFPVPFISNEGGGVLPTKGNIQVATQENGLLVSSKDLTTIESIQLFDITGRLLISNKEINNVSTQVPLNGIKRGTYILKVLNSNGEVFSTKMVY